MTDTIPTRTMTTTTMTAAATLFVAACIPATAGGFDRSRSADNMLALKDPKAPPVHAGGFFSAVSQPNRFAKVRDSGVTIYRRRIHVRLQLTCGCDTSR